MQNKKKEKSFLHYKKVIELLDDINVMQKLIHILII
jgi:hypothetical protein